MTTKELQEYLNIIFNMEINLYIQKNTLMHLQNQYSQLAHKSNIPVPTQKKALADSSDFRLGAGIISAIAGGIIAACVIISNQDTNNSIIESFFASVSVVFWTLLISGICGLAGAYIIGAIIGEFKRLSKQKELDCEYQLELAEYKIKVKLDDERVQRELVQKNYIYQQIELLSKQIEKSSNTLDKLYSYNIIDKSYRNIVAISSFCEYLRLGKTYTLGFDRDTGDTGAYNLYDDEVRHNHIISKLDIIIDKLDTISENQRILADAIREGNGKINRLSEDVLQASSQINNSINKNTAIQIYNGERTQAELSYMNRMNLIYNRHH